MPERHSRPPRPCSSAATTTSSQTAPASARRMSPSTWMPVLASRTTVRPGISSAITTFEPPASTSGRCVEPDSSFSARITAMIASVVSQVIMRSATGPTRRVVSGASGTCSTTGTPPISELTTGGNGSLASYAALIRHVRRVRGQRRTGSPRIRRSELLAREVGRLRRRQGDAGFDEGRRQGGIDVVTTQVLRRDRLPGVVQQFHPGDLSIVREEVWTPVDGDKATATVTGSIPGAPVSLTGTAVLDCRRQGRLTPAVQRLRRGADPARGRQGRELHRQPARRIAHRRTAIHHGVDKGQPLIRR